MQMLLFLIELEQSPPLPTKPTQLFFGSNELFSLQYRANRRILPLDPLPCISPENSSHERGMMILITPPRLVLVGVSGNSFNGVGVVVDPEGVVVSPFVL